MEFLKNNKQLICKLFLIILICTLIIILTSFYFKKIAILTSTSDNGFKNNISNNNQITNNDVISVVLNNNNSDKEETPNIATDEKVSDKELKEEKVNKTEIKKSTSPYYIKVNYTANVVTIYKKDQNDKYTIPYKAMVCSCGTYTPKSGTYKTSSKYRWGKLIHDVYGQYATRIVKSILFHSVPYSSNTNDTLLHNEYDKLGTTASAGCVRLTVADAKWIYDNCPSGTMVEFYSDSNPGPLGKPSAQKISSVEECRNWDPTDPLAGNPWHTYIPETETKDPPTDIPNTNEPAVDTPTTDVPSTDEPAIDTPTTDVPSTDEPAVDSPTTDVPSTDEPAVDTPTTDTPSTDVPTTDTPTTDVPGNDGTTTDTPATDVPITDEPTTSVDEIV